MPFEKWTREVLFWTLESDGGAEAVTRDPSADLALGAAAQAGFPPVRIGAPVYGPFRTAGDRSCAARARAYFHWPASVVLHGAGLLWAIAACPGTAIPGCREAAAPVACVDWVSTQPSVAPAGLPGLEVSEPFESGAGGASSEDWNALASAYGGETREAPALVELEVEHIWNVSPAEDGGGGEAFATEASFARVKLPAWGAPVFGIGATRGHADARGSETNSGTDGGEGSGRGSGTGGGMGRGRGGSNADAVAQSGGYSGSGHGSNGGKGRGGLGGSGSGLASRDAEPLAGNPRPVFPKEAQRKNQSGRLVVRIKVLANGRVGEARVVQSSGFELLDESALQAVRQWRFRPAVREGETVECEVEAPISFKLTGRR